MDNRDGFEEKNVIAEPRDKIQVEMDQARQEMREVALMLEQSQLEVSKLTQRNASITAHLQQVQSQFESLPRPDIRMAYDSALEAQQRLFVMRGQVEKLQRDQMHLKHYLDTLEYVLQVFEGGVAGNSSAMSTKGSIQTVEMVIQAQEAERQRLSRQMHDGPAQALSNFILQTEIAMRLFDIDQVKAKEELSTLKLSATGAFRKVRDFIFELRPMMLDDLGLVPTLKRYVDAFKEQAGIDIRFHVTGTERRLQSYQEVMIFRAIQELLNNAARHSQANQVKAQLDISEQTIKISIDDDGKGFDLENIDQKSGMGLKIIRDRVEMLGGSFDLDTAVGRGTRVVFTIPATPAGHE